MGRKTAIMLLSLIHGESGINLSIKSVFGANAPQSAPPPSPPGRGLDVAKKISSHEAYFRQNVPVRASGCTDYRAGFFSQWGKRYSSFGW